MVNEAPACTTDAKIAARYVARSALGLLQSSADTIFSQILPLSPQKLLYEHFIVVAIKAPKGRTDLTIAVRYGARSTSGLLHSSANAICSQVLLLLPWKWSDEHFVAVTNKAPASTTESKIAEWYCYDHIQVIGKRTCTSTLTQQVCLIVLLVRQVSRTFSYILVHSHCCYLRRVRT